MMGDNRDNSADSRVMQQVGYVPAANILGPARWRFLLDLGRFLHRPSVDVDRGRPLVPCAGRDPMTVADFPAHDFREFRASECRLAPFQHGGAGA